jgi:uncharacterized protein YndB with AHSA1/START domain
MYRIDLAIEIAAPVGLVWRALCEPAIVVQWDSEVVEPINAPPDYPQPGQTVRWRCRDDGSVLIDRPQQVEPGRRLASILELGSWLMAEAYDLSSASGRTRVGLSLELRVRVAVIGPLIEHISAGRRARQGFEASLAGLKRWCEAQTPPDTLPT